MAKLVLCLLANAAAVGHGLLGARASARATGAVETDAARIEYKEGDFVVFWDGHGGTGFGEVVLVADGSQRDVPKGYVRVNLVSGKWARPGAITPGAPHALGQQVEIHSSRSRTLVPGKVVKVVNEPFFKTVNNGKPLRVPSGYVLVRRNIHRQNIETWLAPWSIEQIVARGLNEDAGSIVKPVEKHEDALAVDKSKENSEIAKALAKEDGVVEIGSTEVDPADRLAQKIDQQLTKKVTGLSGDQQVAHQEDAAERLDDSDSLLLLGSDALGLPEISVKALRDKLQDRFKRTKNL